MINYLKSKWGTFRYNYSWSDWVGYIDGWIPRFSFFFPIVGYLIVFNDQISEAIEFSRITSPSVQSIGFDPKSRLHLVYYGLFFLGLSNFIYRVKKPYAFRFGHNSIEYTRTALENFTLGDFLQIHETIRSQGHLTLYGKYYDSEWEGFLIAARNRGEGTDNVKRNASWESAKLQYGSLLRSILQENFFRNDILRRQWLTSCLLFSTLGYVLLALPSIDLFIKVTLSIFVS